MLARLLRERSLVFRLWLAVNVIFVLAALVTGALYVWTAVGERIDKARDEVKVRQETLSVFSIMGLRLLHTEGTFVFTSQDFALLRNLGIERNELYNARGELILIVDPHGETVVISEAYLEYLQTIPAAQARLINGPPANMPPRTILLPRLGQSVDASVVQEVEAQRNIRKTIRLGGDLNPDAMTYATMSPLAVLRGQQFGEEHWVSRGDQVQRTIYALTDLSQAARAIVVDTAIVLFGVLIATSAGAWVLLRTLVYRPLRRYSAIAMQIADGQPLRMPELGSGEMTGLARAVNEMADALESRATIDSLTGLFNHRHYSEEIERLIRIAELTGQPLSVLVADLNEFKQVNDRFGHSAGDTVLREIAATILDWAGGEFVCWRLGGDEFAAAMPATPRAKARTEGLRLRKMIEQRGYAIPFIAVRASITVSIGVATSPADGRTSDDLLRAADSKMYRHKDAVRRPVESA